MGLIRTYRRSGSWLALVALLLQIVLSFGHVHGLAEFADAPGHAALAAAAPTSPVEPPGSDPDGDHHGAPAGTCHDEGCCDSHAPAPPVSTCGCHGCGKDRA